MIGYFISAIFIIFSLLKKDSKLFFILILFWMWVLFTFNYNNADYSMYMNMYYGYIEQSSEFFFSFLLDMARKINLSYIVFRGIYGFICLYLIGITIYKNSKNKSLVLSFYFLFPFVLDVVQIRHFMAISIITYAIPLLYSDNKKSIFKYILLNILAIGFHYMAIFYLILILVKRFSIKKVTIISIVAQIIFLFVMQSNILIDILLKFLPENKVYIYFISDKLRSSYLLILQCLIVQLISLISVFVCYYIYRKHNKCIDNIDTKKEINIYKNTLKINLLILILIPAYFYNLDLIRIFRGISIMNFIAIGNAIEKKNIKDNIIPITIGFALVMLLFYFLILKVNIFEKTGFMVLNYNYILDILK